ncbi:MAG: hypothetical protein LAT82_00300 [Nanoarchaeota archaeon]|nr:hypothetical protein [Nanoarchaeota archaeon]
MRGSKIPKEVAFNLLQILNFEDPSILRIEQEYYSTPLTNPNLIVNEKEISMKYFSNITLIGLEYELIINEIKTQGFLIFATPLEHLLGINIILEIGTKILRIEYEFKTYLIYEKQIEYLQKEFTILEEIEVELFENFNYKTPFSRNISFLMPRNKHKQENIRIVEELLFDKILFTPHINSLDLIYSINEHLFLYDISSNKKFLSLIHKYLHYSITKQVSSPHFEEAEIIECALSNYPLEVIEEEKDILFHHITTQYFYKIIPNVELEIITSHRENLPLPLYIAPNYPIYYPFKNKEDFLEKNGVHFEYDSKELEELIVKDDSFSQLFYTPFYISFKFEQYLTSILFSKIYSNPLEYHILKQFFSNDINNKLFVEQCKKLGINLNTNQTQKNNSPSENQIETSTKLQFSSSIKKITITNFNFKKIIFKINQFKKIIEFTQNLTIQLTKIPTNLSSTSDISLKNVLLNAIYTIESIFRQITQEIKTIIFENTSSINWENKVLIIFSLLNNKLTKINNIMLQITTITSIIKNEEEFIYEYTILVYSIEKFKNSFTDILNTTLHNNSSSSNVLHLELLTLFNSLDFTFFNDLNTYKNIELTIPKITSENLNITKIITSLFKMKKYLHNNSNSIIIKTSNTYHKFIQELNLNCNIELYDELSINTKNTQLNSNKNKSQHFSRTTILLNLKEIQVFLLSSKKPL